MNTDLQRAINIWAEGEPLPVDLAFTLINQGFDVGALEALYLQ